MRGRRFIAKALALILVTMLTVTGFSAINSLSAREAKAAGNVTRAEWLKKLVETFDMTVEDDNYPDNYFADLDEDSEYYYDMLVAVQFGLVDVPAGGNMNPEDGVTREFAASTLNYCLGFIVDEDTDYSFSDTDAVVDRAAAQVAIDRKWFNLIDGEFSPERYITVSEETAMLADAEEVWHSTDLDENHEDTYELKDGIKEVPDDVEAYAMDSGSVYIESLSTGVVSGDKIAVKLNGVPCVYLVNKVKKFDDGILVSVDDVENEEAFENIDIQGTLDASALIGGDDGDDTDISTGDEDNLGGKGGKGLGTKISGSASLGGVTVNAELTNIKIDYAVKLGGESYIKLIADSKVSFKGSVSAKAKVPIIDREAPGLGGFIVYAEVGGSASVSGTNRGRVCVGLAYSTGGGMRLIHEFQSYGFELKCEVEAGVGITARLGLYGDATPFKGYCYVTAGGRASISSASYSAGKPSNCSAFVGFIYAEAGAKISFKLGPVTIVEREYKYPIYTETNSPVKVIHHYEDGREVGICTRENDFIAATGHSPYVYYTRYGSRYWGSGLYGYDGNYGLDGEGKPVIIWEYTVDDDGNATITKYNGNASDLTIPDTLDEHKVIAIGKDAFAGNKSLRYVTIPESVTSIGDGAFKDCTNMYGVEISKNVTVIGNGAFITCSSLLEVKLPESLKELKVRSFDGCSSLRSVYIPKGIEKVGHDTFGLLSGNHRAVFSNCENLSEISFAEDIKVIPGNLFRDCNGLKEVTLPDTLIEIGTDAFKDSSVEKVNFNNSLETIKGSAFANCTNLKEAIFNKNLKTINGNAFEGCTSLEKVFIPKSLTNVGVTATGIFQSCPALKTVEFETGITSIPSRLFESCEGLEEIEIPDSVIYIGQYTFKNCQNLKKVEFPDSITEMDNWAFLGCRQLTGIKLPSRLKHLGHLCFGSCESITTINIPVGLERGGYSDYGTDDIPFNDCSGLKTVEFEEGRTQIHTQLFQNCTGLEELTIPDFIEEIGVNTFNGCTNLKKVTFGKNLKKIGNTAFANCSSLEKIVYNDKIETLNVGVFANCTSLKELVIPETISAIGNDDFSGCVNLEKISIPKNIKSIGDRAFGGCILLTDVTIEDGCESIGARAFENNKILKEIKLPDSVSKLGNGCFSYCEALEKVEFGSGVTEISKECFLECDNLKTVILPQQITSIYDKGFAQCPALTDITINQNVKTIGADVFSYPEKVTIHGVKGSYAEEYANANSIKFVALDKETEKITLSKTEIEIGVNQKLRLFATIDPIDSKDEFTWVSTDEDVFTIDANGNILAKAVGTAQVIAMSGSVIETCDVEVYTPVNSVSLNKGSYEGTTGDELQLVATVKPDTAKYKTVKWSTSDDKVATVDSDGNVKLLAYGTATITVVTDDMNKTATCKITVKAINVTGVTLDKKALDMTVGDSYTLTPTIAPENATNKKVTWTSSKPDVVSVDSDGKLKALSAGTSIIICKTEDGAKTATCTVTVEEGEHTHKWDDGVITKEPSCTEEGIRTYSCSCGESYTEKVDALGHDEITVDEVPASCTEDGFTSYKKCSRCGKILTQGKVIKAKGHLWDNGEVVKEATETEDGLKTYKCKNCDATKDVVIPAGGEEPYDPVYVEEFVGIEDEMNVGDQLEISATLNRNLEPGETFEWVINDLLDVDGNEIEGEPEGTGKYATIDENGILKATGAGMISVSCKINGEDSYYSYYVEIFGSQDAPSAIEVEEVTDTTITVKDIDWCEYSIDGVEWQYSPCFLYLEPDTTYTVYMRRMASGYLLASEPCSLTVTTEKSEEPVWPFKDLSKDSPIAEEVRYAYEHGIANGFGAADENGQVNFKPERKVTRAQFAIMVYGMAGKPSIKGINTDKYTYSDVPSTAGCYSAVVWASSHGIISGYPNGKFKPESNISRSQIAMMLKRFADYKDFGYMYETGGQDIKSFADYGEVKANAESDLQWALDNGIISGITSTKLKPNGDARRDQCAAFCARFYKAFIE
ncbi:MAG: leucine-rich repeat protein [Eubacterium sp.]|nr:leucine-rich repeat protein [Eubacterium sp.]